MNLRIGQGYDIHRLVSGRPLILGGVSIPHDTGLLGHSDADVLIHAIMDALLGAAGLPDIGHFFPPGDPRYAGISSRILLREVRQILHREQWEIVNIDSNLLAEKPRLAPHIAQMKVHLSEDLQINLDSIGIKAGTNEKLGAIGREEGIAALALTLLNQKG